MPKGINNSHYERLAKVAQEQDNNYVDLNGAESYIRKIRNVGKQDYAMHFLQWILTGEDPETRPDYKDFGLSYSGAQSVHMALEEYGVSVTLDN